MTARRRSSPAIDHPDLFVLRRDKPDAQKGKAAGLNYAYRALREYEDRERTIVVIVDADGRLDSEAPYFASSHFADPKVGGMQSLVRMYNRQHPLVWMQDVEFGVYGHLFQAGRNHWGTAGMGGNGQFNRLSALDDVTNEEGPWRDKLTEDQDLGLRLIAAGWEGRQDLRAVVSQQGLSKARPLFRQRTRWSQGNLQAIGLWREVMATKSLGFGPRIEQMAYLFMPFWQGIIGLGLLGALFLAIFGTAPFWGGGPTYQLLFFYLLAFGGTSLGTIAARAEQGPVGWVVGFLIGQVYTLYTWFLWPVLLRSTARQLSGHGSWAKTEREAIGDGGRSARHRPDPQRRGCGGRRGVERRVRPAGDGRGFGPLRPGTKARAFRRRPWQAVAASETPGSGGFAGGAGAGRVTAGEGARSAGRRHRDGTFRGEMGRRRRDRHRDVTFEMARRGSRSGLWSFTPA